MEFSVSKDVPFKGEHRLRDLIHPVPTTSFNHEFSYSSELPCVLYNVVLRVRIIEKNVRKFYARLIFNNDRCRDEKHDHLRTRRLAIKKGQAVIVNRLNDFPVLLITLC